MIKEAANFDNQDYPEGSLDKPHLPSISEEHSSGELLYRESPPALSEVFASHDERAKERAKRAEELDNSNWPQSRIAEALDREFPDLRTPERIEQLEVERLARVRSQATPSGRVNRSNPALRPSIRRLPGYDKRPDK